jgi:hypothetical protein
MTGAKHETIAAELESLGSVLMIIQSTANGL